jgi:hypothetical protein
MNKIKIIFRTCLGIAMVFFQLFPTSFILAVSGGFNVNLQVESEVAAPPPSLPPGPGAVILPEDITPPIIKNIVVKDITLDSAVIVWEVDEQALCEVSWGLTSGYKDGTVSEDAFYREHQAKLFGLSAGTLYHFKIKCKDTNRNSAESNDQQFITLFPPDIEPPANVSDFEAIAGDKKITLQWRNPLDIDFAEVRIFRSETFYPTSPEEGILVYEGNGTLAQDLDLTNGTTYYYTAFSYDKAGNHSSGAVTYGTPHKPGEVPPVVPPVKPPVVPPPPEVEKLQLGDFEFWQADKKLSLKDANIALQAGQSLKVAIDYAKVPEVLKTIMITLKNDNKYFSFLLRANKEKTRYMATLLPPAPGVYPMSLYVLDYKNQALKKIDGWLEVKGVKKQAEGLIRGVLRKLSDMFRAFNIKSRWPWLVLLLMLLFLLACLMLLRRKKHKKYEEKL